MPTVFVRGEYTISTARHRLDVASIHAFLAQAEREKISERTRSGLAHAKSKGIKLCAELPAELPTVFADQRRVTQILHNLINNAITHTPSAGEIRITAEIFPNELEFFVSDSGEGIDAEHLPLVPKVRLRFATQINRNS